MAAPTHTTPPYTTRSNLSAPRVPGRSGNQVTQTNPQPLVRKLNQSREQEGSSSKSLIFKSLLFLIMIGLGVGTGLYLAPSSTTSAQQSSDDATSSLATTNTKTEEGIDNSELFPDSAEGTLQENDGSITEEGTHILVREGGADKTAYLYSSIVDLDKYIGKQVKIMGQTHTAQTAGWLLEVGWIEVID